MAVWALGLNHNTAPLDLRGRFAFALEQLGPTLSALRRSVAHDNGEIAILSTCNRTEIYGVGESAQIQQTLAWLAESGGVSPEALQKYTTLCTKPKPRAMRFGSPAAWIRWCWASLKSWGK